MGMESFFVSVISPKMNMKYESGLRKVFGYDDEYNCDWETYLKQKSYSIEIKKEYIIVDSCIELYLDNTEDKGRYITLIGCFSCYEYAIEKMQDIINSICENVTDTPRVYIGGDINIYNCLRFKQDIDNAYSLKHQEFNKMFKNQKAIIPPSEFYRYIKGKKKFIQKIKRVFVHKNN